MRKQMILLGCAAVLILASGSYAQDKQPFLGVLLDESPLPELLTKHLRLEPGEGLRVVNVSIGSTAERIGLDRDDIVVAFQARKVTDLDEFIAAMKKAGVGAKVSLEVIHLGQRKTMEFQLEPLGKMEWKYPLEPPEPDDVFASRLGRIIKIGPDGKQFEISLDQLPDFGNFDIRQYFTTKYTYRFTVDGENCTVTIEGSPSEENTKVTVQAGGVEHSATVGQMDKLPEKYQGPARQAVESAKTDFRFTRGFQLPGIPQPQVYNDLFDKLPRIDVQRLSEEKDRTIEKLREEMEQLQRRMRQLEERLLNRKDNAEPKSDTGGPSASSPTQEKKPSV